MPHALILGSHSDIARALAQQLASNGHTLTLAGRDKARLDADASDLSIRHNTTVDTKVFDAEDFQSHGQFYDQLDPKPDLVFCVFGYMADQASAQKDWSLAKRMVDVNYTGACSILHHAANRMEQRKSGTIVGISSVAGDRGRASNYYYGSAKAGFTAYLSGLRNRLQKAGVHVVTVKPGFVNTAMTDGLDLPPRLTASPERAARDILRATTKKRNVVYTKGLWRHIMCIIRTIPEGIFKRLSL